MEVEGGFDATDSLGFININAIRLKAHNIVLRERRPYDWRKNRGRR
jgi:argininosuccinate synthase